MFNLQALSAQQLISTAKTVEIPSLVDKLWTIVMDDGIYQAVSFLGTLVAILAMCIWCVQMYRILKKGGSRPKLKEVIFPLILIVLLLNNGRNMKDLTFGIKVPLDKIVAEDSLRSTMIQTTGTDPSETKLSATDELIKSYTQIEKSRYQSSF
jgi:hypothetical protein